MSRVLITGAAGFIGSHLGERLLDAGHAVIGVDNGETGRNDTPFVCYGTDITQREHFYARANEFEPDTIIHCAASYSDPNLWHRDAETNVLGTINATLAAKHHGARLIYFQTALPPISSYAISKIAGEQYIALSGVPSLIFRLANIYGPRNLSGPIPTFYKRLTAGEACTVTDTARDTVYIDDLVDLVMHAFASPVTGKFDVCSGTHYPIEELYRAVAANVDHTPEFDVPNRVPRPADDVAQMELNWVQANQLFGWRATTPLEDGVARAVDWYRENGVERTFTHLSLKG